MRVGECDRASRLVAAASCATACAQLASAHHRERDAPPITLSLVRTVPWYGCPSCDRVALADPLSRLSFFRTTAVMERYVTRVRECLLRGPLGYKHPVPFVSRADSTSKFGPHVYNIRFACCLYTKKKKEKKAWPVSLLYKSKEKDIRLYYISALIVFRSNALKKRRVRHHVAGTKQFLRIE